MTSSRRVSRRSVAQKPSYREPRYDSDYESLAEKQVKPSRQSARIQAAYDDLSTTDANSLSDNELPPPKRKAQRSRPTKRKTRSDTSRTKENISQDFKKRKTSHVAEKTKTNSKPAMRKTALSIPSRGIVPPWQNLEYQILLKIMNYASDLLYTDVSSDMRSTKWLLQVSTLCHSFREAALGALLFSPPLLPTNRAHALIKLLDMSRDEFGEDLSQPIQQKSSKLSVDYRKLVKHLVLNTTELLAPKSGIALEELLKNTPLLSSLVFYHNHDFVTDMAVWAHPNHSTGQNKWQYTKFYPLIDSLQTSFPLRHFEWNARFLNKDDPLLAKFEQIHSSTSYFEALKSVTIRNFILDDAEKLNETVAGTSLIHEQAQGPTQRQARLITWRMCLKGALSKYKELERLSIRNSNVFDTAMLALLPNQLRSLEIENCPFVNSDGLHGFISDRGRHLQSLVLKGNQYMSLAFTTSLKEDAPQLAVLEIDLNYKDPTSYQDTKPLYDSLLPNGPPTWPESLERISIGPLRRLSARDAEEFYQSLIDAADKLKYLRVLELRTLLNEVGWRDRTALRMKWSAKFDEVFNMKHNPNIKVPRPVTFIPRPKLTVQVPVRAKKTVAPTIAVEQKAISDRNLRRRSPRIQDLALSDSQAQASDSELVPPSPTYSDLLAAYDSGEERRQSGREVGEVFVPHGRCHKVVFELSDQRPAQEQFKEDDFLDDSADLEDDEDFHI